MERQSKCAKDTVSKPHTPTHAQHCLPACVCVCVCVFVCVCVCVCVCTRTTSCLDQKDARNASRYALYIPHTTTHAWMHGCMHICVTPYTSHTSMYACKHACTYVCMYAQGGDYPHPHTSPPAAVAQSRGHGGQVQVVIFILEARSVSCVGSCSR